jgi:hypothetical protein
MNLSCLGYREAGLESLQLYSRAIRSNKVGIICQLAYEAADRRPSMLSKLVVNGILIRKTFELTAS